jgi:putative FmdB family regulatory protein
MHGGVLALDAPPIEDRDVRHQSSGSNRHAATPQVARPEHFDIVLSMKGARMPTYEYECNKCRHGFTQVLHIDEQERTAVRCPKCGNQDVTQVIAPVFVRASRKA